MIGARSPLGARLLLAVAMAVATLGSARPAAGQSTEEVLVQRRLEYQAAKDAYEAARSAFSVVERQFSAALEQVGRARRAGDDAALEDAYALAQDRSAPYSSQEERVNEARQRVAEARRALIDVITVRLGELFDRMDQATSAQERNELDALWRDLRNEQEELEDEQGGGLTLTPVVLPEITFDPRDGPEELEAKAQLLDRRAAVADTIIADVDDRIDALNERLRIERQRRDFLANADRFDDTRVPVVSSEGAGERPAAADSTVANRPVTLEERLQALQGYREQLVSYRDQLLIRARQFRERVRRAS
jgi:hypothetical protein